jgi:hypothetical protein
MLQTDNSARNLQVGNATLITRLRASVHVKQTKVGSSFFGRQRLGTDSGTGNKAYFFTESIFNLIWQDCCGVTAKRYILPRTPFDKNKESSSEFRKALIFVSNLAAAVQ